MRANRPRPIRPHSAPCSDASRETAEVSRGHSSGSVLHESGRPRRAEHAKQSGAVGDSILAVKARPGQSSSAYAHVAGFVRILCVAREGAYRTLHEPPTADPHGGWCGGWGLETAAYPIGRHCAGQRLTHKHTS